MSINRGMDKEEVHIVAQMVKNLPAMQEIQVQFLGQEDPLENPMDRGAWRAQSMGLQRVGYD